MIAIYEFTAFLRFAAENVTEARMRARDLVDAVPRGDATLALDGSEPSVEVEGQSDDVRLSYLQRPGPAPSLADPGTASLCGRVGNRLPTGAGTKPRSRSCPKREPSAGW